MKIQAFVAPILVLSLVMQPVAVGAELHASATPVPMTPLEMLVRNPSLIEAPQEWVEVSEAHTGSSGKLIIHIQDAHANVSGQKSLAKALESLIQKYGVSLVLVEGGSENVTLNDVKNSVDPIVRQRIANEFLLSGKMAGEEYLNFTTDFPMQLEGIEDEDLYRRTLQAFREVRRLREASRQDRMEMRSAVDFLKSKMYPDVLKEYEKHALFIEEGFGGILDPKRKNALEALIDAAKTAGIDLETFKTIRLYVELTQKVDFKDAAEAESALRSMDLPTLFEEQIALEDELYGVLLQDDSEKGVWAADRYLKLLDKGLETSLTTDELQLFATMNSTMKFKSWVSFLNRRLVELGQKDRVIPLYSWMPDVQVAIEKFYRLVSERDGIFVANARKIMGDHQAQASFLIAGGYHTERLKGLWQAEGHSYVVLTPRIDHSTDRDVYENIVIASTFRALALKQSNSRYGELLQLTLPQAARLSKSVTGVSTTQKMIEEARRISREWFFRFDSKKESTKDPDQKKYLIGFSLLIFELGLSLEQINLNLNQYVEKFYELLTAEIDPESWGFDSMEFDIWITDVAALKGFVENEVTDDEELKIRELYASQIMRSEPQSTRNEIDNVLAYYQDHFTELKTPQYLRETILFLSVDAMLRAMMLKLVGSENSDLKRSVTEMRQITVDVLEERLDRKYTNRTLLDSIPGRAQEYAQDLRPALDVLKTRLNESGAVDNDLKYYFEMIETRLDKWFESFHQKSMLIAKWRRGYGRLPSAYDPLPKDVSALSILESMRVKFEGTFSSSGDDQAKHMLTLDEYLSGELALEGNREVFWYLIKEKLVKEGKLGEFSLPVESLRRPDGEIPEWEMETLFLIVSHLRSAWKELDSYSAESMFDLRDFILELRKQIQFWFLERLGMESGSMVHDSGFGGDEIDFLDEQIQKYSEIHRGMADAMSNPSNAALRNAMISMGTAMALSEQFKEHMVWIQETWKIDDKWRGGARLSAALVVMESVEARVDQWMERLKQGKLSSGAKEWLETLEVIKEALRRFKAETQVQINTKLLDERPTLIGAIIDAFDGLQEMKSVQGINVEEFESIEWDLKMAQLFVQHENAMQKIPNIHFLYGLDVSNESISNFDAEAGSALGESFDFDLEEIASFVSIDASLRAASKRFLEARMIEESDWADASRQVIYALLEKRLSAYSSGKNVEFLSSENLGDAVPMEMVKGFLIRAGEDERTHQVLGGLYEFMMYKIDQWLKSVENSKKERFFVSQDEEAAINLSENGKIFAASIKEWFNRSLRSSDPAELEKMQVKDIKGLLESGENGLSDKVPDFNLLRKLPVVPSLIPQPRSEEVPDSNAKTRETELLFLAMTHVQNALLNLKNYKLDPDDLELIEAVNAFYMKIMKWRDAVIVLLVKRIVSNSDSLIDGEFYQEENEHFLQAATYELREMSSLPILDIEDDALQNAKESIADSADIIFRLQDHLDKVRVMRKKDRRRQGARLAEAVKVFARSGVMEPVRVSLEGRGSKESRVSV